MTDDKKKLPKTTFKKIKKSDSLIQRQDQNTFYVKSSDPEKDPYFVFKSINEGWLCDCMSFVMSLTDDGHSPECKHIRLIKETFKIQ